MAETQRLYGLKAIVTGAADGIGEAIARTLVKHGARVLAADAPGSGIESAFRRLRGISTLAVDPQAAMMAAKLAQESIDRLGGADILVNNFMGELKSRNGLDEEALARQLAPVLQKIADTSAAALPLLQQSPAGRIINIGCLRSAFGRDGSDALARTEAALAALTASQAAEFGGFGINVNYIQPGAIMTARSRAVFDADKDFRDRCIRQSAAKRLGEALDVAKVALFLASDDSAFVSGTGITVDGGRVPPGNLE
jgi:NAD(P)-dependent dehydrogenase (short-subunit alcohol dehydrogenase family)